MLVDEINCSIEEINKAIEMKGSVRALAIAADVSIQTIYDWRTNGLPPIEIGIRIFDAVDGEVDIYKICPHFEDWMQEYDRLVVRNYRRLTYKNKGDCKDV